MRVQFAKSRTSVGSATATYLTIQFDEVPAGAIYRLRAYVSAGTAINQVECILAKTATNAGVFDFILGTDGLEAQPFDTHFAGGVSYTPKTSITSGGRVFGTERSGTIYALVRVDNATTDHTVNVSFDVEPY